MKRTNSELRKLRSQITPVAAVGFQGPQEDDLTHDQLMSKYKISNDGVDYIFERNKIDKIEDAVAYAKSQG